MSGSDTYETKENHMSRRFTIHRIHKQIAVAAIGVALLISPQVANAADTSGLVGNGVFNSGDFGAWDGTSYAGSLADWTASEDSTWSNNLYFSTTTSPDDKTSSAANGKPGNAVRVWSNNLSGTSACFPAFGMTGYSVSNTGNLGLNNNISSHTTLSRNAC